MRLFPFRFSHVDRGQKLWPILSLLLLTIALPMAGGLWYMSHAIQNERDANRQRLSEVYKSRLKDAIRQAESAWTLKLDSLMRVQRQKSGSEAFAEVVRLEIADSALLYNKGNKIYPPEAKAIAAPPRQEPFLWEKADRLEFEMNKPEDAAEIYGEIARKVEESNESAKALLSRAGCLKKAGREKEALKVLTAELGKETYRDAVHADGRLLQPDSQIFALELIKDAKNPLFEKTAQALFERLNDYGEPVMQSSQRLSRMHRLRELWPECPLFTTLAAEEMVAKFDEADLSGLIPGRLSKISDSEAWGYQLPDKSAIALFHEESIYNFLNSIVSPGEQDARIIISPLIPGEMSAAAFSSETIDAISPDWRLALNLKGADPFESESGSNIVKYVWIGIIMAAIIALLSTILIWHLRRQVHLTRLKNDLISTVSHELKTPLASMRLLVDTLLDGHCQDTRLVREYLEMISKENARLSNLIEGFLTFSRMERNKVKFDRTLLQASELVKGALEAEGDRLQGPGCNLTVDLAPDLPPVIGDRGALTTVLVNLLNNALKYSGSEKVIVLRGFAVNGSVCLEVQDNGIGFSKRVAKRIFDRFYQVDQTLSRRAEGCGLGLSIVQFIITAHNGSVSATSQSGKGSTFTVRLPAASAQGDSYEQ